jgi:hypothetical protein
LRLVAPTTDTILDCNRGALTHSRAYVRRSPDARAGVPFVWSHRPRTASDRLQLYLPRDSFSDIACTTLFSDALSSRRFVCRIRNIRCRFPVKTAWWTRPQSLRRQDWAKAGAQWLSANKTRIHDDVPTSVPSPREFRVLWDGSSGPMLYVHAT